MNKIQRFGNQAKLLSRTALRAHVAANSKMATAHVFAKQSDIVTPVGFFPTPQRYSFSSNILTLEDDEQWEKLMESSDPMVI